MNLIPVIDFTVHGTMFPWKYVKEWLVNPTGKEVKSIQRDLVYQQCFQELEKLKVQGTYSMKKGYFQLFEDEAI